MDQTRSPLTSLSRLTLPEIRKLLLGRPAGSPSADTPARQAQALFGPPPEGGAQEKPGTVVEFLKHVALCEGLGRMDLQRLARIVHEREYSDGEYITREGKPGAALFVLRRGLVEVVKRDRSGKEVIVATLEPPASFEESAATGTETTRWFSTRARGPVSLLALGRSDLDGLCDDFPPLASKLLMRLSGIMALRLQMLLDVLYRSEAGEAEKHVEHEEPTS